MTKWVVKNGIIGRFFFRGWVSFSQINREIWYQSGKKVIAFSTGNFNTNNIDQLAGLDGLETCGP